MKLAAILMGISFGLLWGLNNSAHGWVIGAMWSFGWPLLLLTNPQVAPPKKFRPVFALVFLPLLIFMFSSDGIDLLFFGRTLAAIVLFASQWLFVSERDKIIKNAE